MIEGIGIDLVENERIEKIINKWGQKFLHRVFSEGEIVYCSRHSQASINYGARFAAKEAFLKVLVWVEGLSCVKLKWCMMIKGSLISSYTAKHISKWSKG